MGAPDLQIVPMNVVMKNYQLPFPLYEFQADAVNDLAPLERAGYYLDVGCVDADTEYLSNSGWKRIADYEGGEVGQYNLDGTVEMVMPSAFVKKPCEVMYRLKTSYGIDQMLSPEHRVLYKSQVSDRLKVISAEELANKHWGSPQGFRGKFLTTFKPVGRSGIELNRAQLRVQVAVIADGYFPSEGTDRVIVNLKKKRKKDRLRTLLDFADIRFTECDRATAHGYTYFTFRAPWRTKSFDSRFYEGTIEQLAIIADECRYWDGSTGRGVKFFTSVKESADFIQYAFAATGTQSTVNSAVRDRTGEGRGVSTEHTVQTYVDSPFSCINGTPGKAQSNVELVPSTDGFKYCFMVPSTFLILRRNGRIFATGNTGKTITSIAACLYKLHLGMVKHVICLMPPVLITNWARTLGKIPGVTHTEYRGTPTVRAKLNLGTQFILMSYQIFKKDWPYLAEQFNLGEIALVCDEAKAIKNVGSDTYKKVRDFSTGNHILLLEGTPLNSPVDGYAYVRTTSPGVYRNLAQFERIHVEERDFFNKPTKWQNLELLRENLKLNSVRILKRDVLKDLPPITYTPIYYDLAPKHLKLYNELADQQFKLLSNGDKIDLTNASALYNALQQVPVNSRHFSGGEVEPTALDLIHETMDELDRGKLVVYTRYIMTNRLMLEACQKYGVVAIYGEVSPKQKQLAIDRFVQDPDCRMIVLQTEAGGAGIDGLQDVCSDGLFIEMPLIPTTFHQACGRIDRSGQKLPVNIRVAIANKTIQHRIFEMVMEKDTLVNSVVRGPKDIRDAIHGL